ARATAAGRLAAERQAREAADRTLAATLQRHEALASAVGDLEAQLRVEAAQLEELEARHREAQARAHSDETASEASKEQARAHAERIAALEAQCQEAEARAKQQVAERAELEHALEILGTQL